jgi:C4-dicarboxylate-specific signal transduction histidine kinase
MPLQTDAEALRPLLVLIDFLQNPAEFAKRLEGLKENLEYYDKIMKVYPTVKEADHYFAEAKAYVAKVNVDAAAQDAALVKAKEDFAKSKLDQETQLTERAKATSAAERKVLAREADATKREAALEKLLVETSQRERALLARQEALVKAEADLAERVSKISALVGAPA